MARLAAVLASPALTALLRLEPTTVAGGWLGGVAGTAADSPRKACQLGPQVGEIGRAAAQSPPAEPAAHPAEPGRSA
jgi:hypothetical protein